MYRIKKIVPASDVQAGYIGASDKEDLLISVRCWAVVQVDDGDDRLVGMVEDPTPEDRFSADLMEADDDDAFIGYYGASNKDVEKFLLDCKTMREAEDEGE